MTSPLRRRIGLVLAILVIALVLFLLWQNSLQNARVPIADVEGSNPRITDPRPTLITTLHVADAVGWRAGETPTPAAGLRVAAFVTGLDHPRWLLPLPNGDVLVAETNEPPKPGDKKGLTSVVEGWAMKRAGAKARSANRITLLRDADGDGVAESRSVLIGGLNSPFGMALVGGTLYIADTDALMKVPFTPGQTHIDARAVKVIDLPAGPINHHWTKNVIASPDGTRLFVTIGSNSNVGERGQAVEAERARIWEVDPATGQHRTWAYGIRNPNGMAWEPATKRLWTVSNERDELGPDIVPDYLTEAQLGGFYGWPWYYWGGYPDSRPKDPDTQNLQQYVVKPDYALGPHTASLGLTFATGAKLGPRFAQGAFIGQHGSWNRKPFSGYKVVYVAFDGKGQPQGKPVDVLTGFLAGDKARGRPVGVVIDARGGLLVADDVGNRVWRVTAAPAMASR